MATLHSIEGILSRGVPSVLPERVTEQPSDASFSRRVLRGALLRLVLVLALLIWVAVGTGLFGYQAVNAQGTSMEPTLRNGDVLWVKQLDIAEVKVGDIVTLGNASVESITHRVIKIEPLLSGSYLVVTKGDANLFTEGWEVSRDETVPVMAARVPLGGYVLEFLASVPGRALLIGVVAIMVAMLLRRRRNFFSFRH